MKAIFDTRLGSGYDDDVARRYHFPNRYLGAAQNALGDWIVYREPRRGGGREGYVAAARVDRIEPDPANAALSCAMISNFLPFDAVVPLRRERGFYEEALGLIGSPSKLGAALQGKSIRTISEREFGVIVRAGLSETLSPNNAIRLGLDQVGENTEIASLLNATQEQQERQIETLLLNRKIRDASFRRAVLRAPFKTLVRRGIADS